MFTSHAWWWGKFEGGKYLKWYLTDFSSSSIYYYKCMHGKDIHLIYVTIGTNLHHTFIDFKLDSLPFIGSEMTQLCYVYWRINKVVCKGTLLACWYLKRVTVKTFQTVRYCMCIKYSISYLVIKMHIFII